MKILNLISSSGLFGAEHVVLNLASFDDYEGIVGALHNVHNPHTEIIEEARKLNLKYEVFPSKGRMDFQTVIFLKDYLIKNNVDVIHSHNYKSDMISFLASRLAKREWVSTNHVWHGTDQKLRFYEKLDALILRFADKVIAVSEEIKTDLIKKGIKSSKVIVINNGIDIDKFRGQNKDFALKRFLGFNDGDVVVVIVGRLSVEKGHELFLKSALRIHQKHAQVKFLIVGDGPLKDKIKEDVRQAGLKDVTALAGLRSDMPVVYAMCDIFVNASFIEGLPMTLLESMASKVAVVCSSVGAIPMVIRSGENGLLFKPGDEEALTGHVNFLIENETARKAYGETAFQDVCRTFSFKEMSRQYFEVYKTVLSGKKTSHL